MRVAVGSQNPVKIESVREVLCDYSFGEVDIVIPKKIVQKYNQPLTLHETIDGAIARATGCFEEFEDLDWGVGIESGLMHVPKTKTRHMGMSVCAISDGENCALGISQAFEYPPQIMPFVLKGDMNVSEAYRTAGLTNHEYLGYAEGVIGHLTKGKRTRKTLTKESIESALVQFLNPELYFVNL